MRRLLPDVRDEPLEELYTDLVFPSPPAGRPHLFLDMVASVDGAATLRGRTAGLGGAADAVAFSRLREWCDVVLVGATTVRVEDYGPPRPTEPAQARRVSRGLAPVPRIAIVTASLALDPAARVFSDPERRPLVLAPEDADASRVAALREVADVVPAGRGRVDLGVALARLRHDGVRLVLCEGGPTLNVELLDAGLVDELFLTVAPHLVGASDLRILEGPLRDGPVGLEIAELRAHDGELLLRYRVRR